jgi:hypothetical protein
MAFESWHLNLGTENSTPIASVRAWPAPDHVRKGVSTLRHRASDGSLDHGRAENIHRVVRRRRHIGKADGYHLNKSAVAMATGILGFPHFQPHTQRRPT